MSTNLSVLCLTAASIGCVHTLLGPDHYVPFIAMARAGRWSTMKTLMITLLCGAGHVLGSVVLGMAGIGLGTALFTLEQIESFRGAVAGWFLLAFGLAYLAWGLRRAMRNRPHSHWHAHADGTVHIHEHVHEGEHAHVHEHANAKSLTPWILFTIFVFGPCEPLIPLLMYPAATQSWISVVIVSGVFAATTLATMTLIVCIGCWGSFRLHVPRLERFGHALAGLALACCGLAVTLGL